MADEFTTPQEGQEYLQGLQQALNSFVGGVRSYQISSALTQANERVQQIKMSGIAEAKQREALGNVAQGLVMQMSGLGAAPAQIEQTFAAINPKVPTIQTAEQAILMGDKEQQAKGMQLKQMEFAQKRAESEALINRQALAQERVENRQLNTMARKGFQTENAAILKDEKDMQTAIRQAQAAKSLLTTRDPDLTRIISPIKTMLAKASGEVGNLTQMERDAFGGSQDVFSRINRAVTEGTVGELPESDRRALAKLAQVYINNGQSIIKERKMQRAKNYVDTFQDVPFAQEVIKQKRGFLAELPEMGNEPVESMPASPQQPAANTPNLGPGFKF